MLFSVIIPTYHRNDLLAKCLDCLAPGKQALAAEHYEVIVSDDGSKSTAREMVETLYPWAKWVNGPKRGSAANRNNGADHAKGEWLVFTDDDCLPDSIFLYGYWMAAIKNIAPVLEGKTSPTGIRTRVDMECPANEHGGYLWSCNMAIRRDLFFELNGFDSGFPGAAMEDVDFRTRLLKAGKIFKFAPSALVLHPWRLKKGISFLRLYGKSRFYFITKHPETANGIRLTSLASNLVRKYFRQLPSIIWACRGKGLGREMLLDFYTVYVLSCYPGRNKLKRI